jgi:pimeloyl-ACP methyl ester carboxylesterase
VLIGCSRGGQIATDTTVESPERVAALVTVGSGPGGFQLDGPDDEEPFWAAMEQAEQAGDWEKVIELDIQLWGAGVKRSVDHMPASFVQKMVEMGRRNYSHTGEKTTPIPLTPSNLGRLGEINVPTLVIWGDLDTSYILQASPALADGIRGAQRVIIPGTAHLPNMEKPEEFNRIVLNFLSSLKA